MDWLVLFGLENSSKALEDGDVTSYSTVATSTDWSINAAKQSLSTKMVAVVGLVVVSFCVFTNS